MLFSVVISNCIPNNSTTIENYYSNPKIFNIDTIYEKVLIDGKYFTIKVLSDKLNENLEKYNKKELEFNDVSPKTIIIYSSQSGRIKYVKKFDSSIPFFSKTNGNLAKDGKLYLHWLSYGGGSGYSTYTNLVSLKNGKINISWILESSEMDYLLFNKNDKELLVLKGIWGNDLDEFGDPIETHFSKHKYKIMYYRISSNDFEEKELGITKDKYSSEDDGISNKQLLNQIIKGERFLEKNIIVSDYINFNNYNCKVWE